MRLLEQLRNHRNNVVEDIHEDRRKRTAKLLKGWGVDVEGVGEDGPYLIIDGVHISTDLAGWIYVYKGRKHKEVYTLNDLIKAIEEIK